MGVIHGESQGRITNPNPHEETPGRGHAPNKRIRTAVQDKTVRTTPRIIRGRIRRENQSRRITSENHAPNRTRRISRVRMSRPESSTRISRGEPARGIIAPNTLPESAGENQPRRGHAPNQPRRTSDAEPARPNHQPEPPRISGMGSARGIIAPKRQVWSSPRISQGENPRKNHTPKRNPE